MTLPDLSPAKALSRACEQHPQRLSLVDISSERTWTCAQSWESVRRLVTVLREHGISSGSRVGVVSPNSAWHFLLHLACSWLHAVSVPLSPKLPAHLAHDLLAACHADLVVGDIHGSSLSVAELAALADAAHPADDTPAPCHSEVAAVIHTSGSTGLPRPVELTHANLWWASMCFRDGFEYCPGTDVVGVCAPLSHVGGFNGTTLDCFSHGGTLVVLPHFEALHVLSAVEKYSITMMFLVPVMCHLLLDALAAQHPSHVDLSSWKRPLIGGDRMSPELSKRMEEVGLRPIHVWGMTETGGAGAMCSPDVWRKHLGTIGRPFPYVDVRVCDDLTSAPLPNGHVGELYVRGPGVADSEIALRGIDGWLPTGDVAYTDEDGFIHFVSRASRMINTGGELVSPLHVEDVLRRHPRIAEALVVGIPDERWGQVVAAVLVASSHEDEDPPVPDVTALRKWLAKYLAPWEQVRAIQWVSSLPTTSTGKADPAAALSLFS